MSKHSLIGNLLQKCIHNKHKNILSIGESYKFPLSTVSLNFSNSSQNENSLKSLKKYSDKYFDFTYCYNIFTNENPTKYCKEINRVSKEGVIETYSPLKSLILKKNNTEYITWTDYNTNTLCFIQLDEKYNSDEMFMLVSNDIKNNSQIFYHNFYIWDLNNQLNIKIYNHNSKEEYLNLLKQSSFKSICNTEILMNIF
jgi:hypothetical protein